MAYSYQGKERQEIVVILMIPADWRKIASVSGFRNYVVPAGGLGVTIFIDPNNSDDFIIYEASAYRIPTGC